jgi:tetratricopeptide (TPR) repeat protein
LGTARIRTGDAIGGQRLVDRILREGDSAKAQMMMGSAHVMGGEFDKAAVAFRRAIELDPKLPFAHSHLGKTLLELGDRDEALRQFELEIGMNPTDFDAQLLSGVILRERQQWKGALAALEHARKIRSAAMEVPYQIALAQLGAGMTAEACRELEQLLDAAPGFREARVSLATAYARLGQLEKAAEQQALLRPGSANPAKPQ